MLHGLSSVCLADPHFALGVEACQLCKPKWDV